MRYLFLLLLPSLAHADDRAAARARASLAFARQSQPASQPRGALTEDEQRERDEIFQLAAYALVAQDWQTPGEQGRGHNIGAILVNPEGRPVYAARNCNFREKNHTNHAEVRLIQGYLNKTGVGTLRGHTIYTTLEPCAQCAGMMTLQEVSRAVYGQTDPAYGKAFERLQLKTPQHEPYPRPVKSEKSTSDFCRELDEKYAASKGQSMTSWLRSQDAHTVYASAALTFWRATARHSRNADVLAEARKLVESHMDETRQPVRASSPSAGPRPEPLPPPKTMAPAPDRRQPLYRGKPSGQEPPPVIYRRGGLFRRARIIVPVMQGDGAGGPQPQRSLPSVSASTPLLVPSGPPAAFSRSC